MSAGEPHPPSGHHLPFGRLTVLSKVGGPFSRLMVLSKVEGLTALSKAEGLRYTSSFVIPAYW